jgi:ubiquinone/menaquinone biosynthesis C-methylase UbiE
MMHDGEGRRSAGQKHLVQGQFTRAGTAYVTSTTHASGDDLARLVEIAAPQPHERVLDIATGGGHAALALAPHARWVLALDLTPKMISVALTHLRRAGAYNVAAVVADAESLPIATASIDIVTCRIAPHHFPSPERFVAEAARVLAPNGRFILIDSTVPEGSVGMFYNEFERLRDPSHVRSLTAAEWCDVITRAGLALRTIEHFPKTHQFDDWTDRMHVPADIRAALTERMRNAPQDVWDVFRPVWDGDRLVAFTDTKTLFAAQKAPALPRSEHGRSA